MRHVIALLTAALLSAPALAQGHAGHHAQAAPVDLSNRPAEAMALDNGRHPQDVLAHSHIGLGATVLDVMAGQGYYTELLARVVGPKGRVIALEPTAYLDDPKVVAGWQALMQRQPNVTLLKGAPGEVTLPGKLDAAFFHLTYHDLYWESEKYKYPRMDVDAFNRRLFAAMKPGGQVIIIDHVGIAGMDSRRQADATHRIDPAVVKADMARAGFRFVGEESFLKVTGDDPAKLVFAPEVRGKTDRFFYRFVKP